jgi:hypothetical protein
VIAHKYKEKKMAIDMKKMRAKLAQAQKRGSGASSNFWRPQDGEQTIRIVPTEDGDPFKDYFFHYNVGNNPGFLCPKKNFGDTCAVCDFAYKLYQEGTPDSIKMAKSLFARQRFFSPVMVRGEEESGVRVWGYGKTAYEALLQLVLNPEYGDITDVEAGTDLNLTYGKPAGAQFPQTNLQPRRRTSSLCENITDEQCRELLDSIPDFDGLFERKTSADVEKVLDEYLSTDETAEESSTETTHYNNGTTVDWQRRSCPSMRHLNSL